MDRDTAHTALSRRHDPPDRRDPAQVQRFLAAYEQHRGFLFGYLLSQTGDRAWAEELLQETTLLLWREFHQFEPGTNFKAWARQIALNRIRDARRRQRRQPALLDNELAEKIADTRQQMDDHLQHRWDTLRGCLDKLRPQDASLVNEYYGEGASARQVAQSSGRSEHAIRKSIKRIRRALFECVGHRPT